MDDGMNQGEVQVVESSIISSVDRVEIDIQIATAKRYPRVVSACIDEAKEMILRDPDVAQASFYVLDFIDKRNPPIGPSIRMAEAIACSWGNLRYGSRPVEITEDVVIAQGYCFDLQKNIANTTTKSRPIRDKNGNKYKPDLINKTMLAAQSVALRDAILNVVPRNIANQIMKEAMAVAHGDAKSLGDRIDAMIKYFIGLGVTEAQVLALLEVADRRDVTLQHVAFLRGIVNSVRDGVASLDSFFYPSSKADGLDGLAKAAAEEAKADTKAKAKAKPIPDVVDSETGEVLNAAGGLF